MKVIKVSISELKPYEKNARTHPKKQINLLMANIKEFGFTTPLLIDENNNIIAGHGRFEAVKKMKWTEVDCVRMEGLTEAQVNALRLADNKIAQLSGWDDELIAEDLLKLETDLANLTGFDKDDFIDKESFEGELEFSEELMLEHNYVVLYFDNIMDWNVAIDKLGLKKVKRVNEGPGKQGVGIGRVIRGKDVIDRL